MTTRICVVVLCYLLSSFGFVLSILLWIACPTILVAWICHFFICFQWICSEKINKSAIWITNICLILSFFWLPAVVLVGIFLVFPCLILHFYIMDISLENNHVK